MRILVHPPRTWAGGPSINVMRVSARLEDRCRFGGGKWFRYTGLGVRWFDLVWLLNAPRWTDRILASGRPVVSRMGQFTLPAWCAKMKRPYPAALQQERDGMFRVVRQARRVVFLSQWVRQNFEEALAEQGQSLADVRWSVINNAVDLQHFSPADASSAGARIAATPDGGWVIGTTGSLRNRFRLDTLFETSKRLTVDHRLLIVGRMDDACRARFDEWMQDAALQARTTWRDWVHPQDLPAVYRQMHCLFHPVAGESCSTVLPEALACGVPVVTPAYGGPADYVSDGGVLVEGPPWEYDDAFCDAMATGVSRVLGDQSRYALAARATAKAHLDLAKTAERWWEVFEAASTDGR